MSITTERSTKGKGREKKAPTYTDEVDDLQDILTGIPDRPTKGLMTFEELQAKIGFAPKKDRFGGLKKMSTRYKAIGARLKDVQDALRTATIGDLAGENGRETFEASLNDQLDEIVRAGRAYQKKHTGKKGRAVQGLLDDVERFRQEISPALDRLVGDGEDDAYPEDMPVDQGIAARNNGIKPGQLKGVSPKHCDFAKFNDQTADVPPIELAKGNVNSVQLVTHGGVERVFKKEQQSDTSGAWAPGMMGIDVGSDPRYGNRNIAGGMIGNLLGTKVMPQSSFAISNGEVGLLMDKAPGETVQKLVKDKRLNPDSFTPKALASLQKQMMDLEACDILTGQTDRHPGNYMIDIKGDEVTVTAIDNDFAFPNTDQALSDEIPPRFAGMNSAPNLPALMSKEIADKIKAINFDRDVAPGLADLLNPAEIKDTKTRFQVMKDHVSALERTGCIVADWTKWRGPPPKKETATDYLANAGKGKKNLFDRDFGEALEFRD